MDIKSEEHVIAWLSLARDTRFSTPLKHQLLTKLVCPTLIYQQSYEELCALLNLLPDPRKNRAFLSQREKGVALDRKWLEHGYNHLVCWGDKMYPTLLAQIEDPPVCLFVRGKLGLLSEAKLSMVGSRRPTSAGVKMAEKIAVEIAQLGVVITSGMALGIDAVAHRSALTSNAATIAVLGCGLDIVYPARHKALFEQIAQHGLLLSEYPIGYSPTKYTFPQRNRIVSGLSYGVVIVEAADKSGTLITARLAMEQNREVFVVPGTALNPQYVGSHRLIKQGAILTTSIDDIVYELTEPLQQLLLNQSSNSDGQKCAISKSINYPLLTHINYEPTSINDIILSSGLTASKVSSMLLTLEIEGLVINTDGHYLRVC